jgi:hypothetical protein
MVKPKAQIMTKLIAFEGQGILLGGKSDGSIIAFSASEGTELGALYSHSQGVSNVLLEATVAKGLVVSADNSGRVLVTRLIVRDTARSGETGRALPAIEILLDHRLGAAVTSLMIDKDAIRLLVRGHDMSELWDLSTGHVLRTRGTSTIPVTTTPVTPANEAAAKSTASNVIRAAFQHPRDADLFIMIEEDTARVFKWSNFEEITPAEGIHLKRPHRVSSDYFLGPASYHIGPNVVFEHHAPYLRHQGIAVVWLPAAFDHLSKSARFPNENIDLRSFEEAALTIVGVSDDSRLLFVDRDLWICSKDLRRSSSSLTPHPSGKGFRLLRSPSPSSRDGVTSSRPGHESSRAPGLMNNSTKTGHTRRHFFALSEWRDGTNRLNCTMISRHEVPSRRGSPSFAFVFGHRVIVVVSGTDFAETIAINTNNNM